MFESKFIAALIYKRIMGQPLSEAEKLTLDSWINESGENRVLFDRFSNSETLQEDLKDYVESRDKTWERINSTIHQEKSKPARSRRAWRNAAAAILVLLSAALLYYIITNRSETGASSMAESKPAATDIAAPSGSHAILTIDGSKEIILDNAKTGSIAREGNVNISKTADGRIIYSGQASEVRTNTLSVPRGSLPYVLQLIDGTIVWLNAGSSITYPTAFTGTERNVELAGEGYFEVTHNPARPFKLRKPGIDYEIQVLGTSFNVNAYDDESSIKVTLLQGSVKVSRLNGESKMLKPGEQAHIASNITVLHNVDTEAVMAWKNGMFNFSGANIKEIMRQISRWYDADIVYEGNVSDIDLLILMSRRENVSEILRTMEKTGTVRFRIEGKKIIVSK